MTQMLRSIVAAALLALLLVGACSRHRSASPAPAMNVKPPSGFSLILTDASGQPLDVPADRISLRVASADEDCLVTAVLAQPTLPLGADLYAQLHFDARRWHPVDFTVGDAWGSEQPVVSLAVFEAGSPLPIGISLVKPYRDESVPTGELFSVRFAPGGENASKVSARAPGPANALAASEVHMSVDELTVTFDWLEKNRGDYNRDSTVAISDITPLAAHFNESVEDSPGNEVIDGNLDDALTIADITPIAANFGSSIAGYRLWRSDKSAGQFLPNWDDPDHPEVSATRPDPDTSPPGRLPYTYTDTAPDDAVFYRLYAYGDGEAGAASEDLYPFGGGPTDTTPPEWESDIGIVSLEKVTTPQVQLRFTFGKATDADTPPVAYRVYWQEGSILDWATSQTRDFTEFSPEEPLPYARALTASDGIQAENDYAVGVRAFDSASRPNFTTNANYLTTAAGPVDTTPPEWVLEEGITSATPGDGQVSITWGEATDADSPPVAYLIYYAESAAGVDWEAPAQREVTPPATGTTITNLTNSVEYEFGVRARDSAPMPNVTDNTNTLAAMPEHIESPYPFGMPPGLSILAGVEANDTAIETDCAGNPAIVSVNKGDGGLWLHYYDGDGEQWVSLEVAPGPSRLYHPDVLLVDDEILVSAFDSATGELRLFRGNSDATEWTSEVVNQEQQYTVCYASEMDYSPICDEIGMVAVFSMEEPPGDPDNPPNEELHYFHKSLSSEDFEHELIDDSEPSISFASLKFNPDSGSPGVAYARGRIKYSIAEVVIETKLAYAEYDPVSGWDKFALPQDRFTEAMDFDFERTTNEPVIVFSDSVEVETPGGGTSPITDAASYERAAGNWYPVTVKKGKVRLDGLNLVFDFYGLDSQVSFTDSGDGVYAFIHAQPTFDASTSTWLILTEVQESLREMGWTTPVPITDPDTGASAISLAFDGQRTQISFVAIGPQTDLLVFAVRNDYVSGSLAYYRD